MLISTPTAWLQHLKPAFWPPDLMCPQVIERRIEQFWTLAMLLRHERIGNYTPILNLRLSCLHAEGENSTPFLVQNFIDFCLVMTLKKLATKREKLNAIYILSKTWIACLFVFWVSLNFPCPEKFNVAQTDFLESQLDQQPDSNHECCDYMAHGFLLGYIYTVYVYY